MTSRPNKSKVNDDKVRQILDTSDSGSSFSEYNFRDIFFDPTDESPLCSHFSNFKYYYNHSQIWITICEPRYMI